ncbi:MAG: PQQ-like beta-propeller repeat protein [Verrucomicrobiaceae bacterium]|nr:PQQ-like beta-propeller repeat protein [Verrucomicrobiaceae bacterium]
MVKQHRLYLPVIFLVLALAGWLAVANAPEMDFNFQAWANWGIGLLLTLLIVIWFVFLSGLTWKTRLWGLFMLLASAGLLRAALRVDGSVSGTGLPRFRWFWTEPESKQFVQMKAAQAPSLVADADFPQFLGPQRDGIVPVSEDYTLEGAELLWRQPIGEGWGAFCVVGHRAMTQEQRGDEEWVTCYDLGTGAALWHHADKTRFVEWQGGDGPRATPSHREGKVYAIGATGNLNCLHLETGEVLWSADILGKAGRKNLKWGISGSPLLHKDLVIVTGGDIPGPTLLAFDAASGQLKWEAEKVAASYASPSLATIGGKEVLIYSAAPGIYLHDPMTGAVLHFEKWGNANFPKGSQPTVLPQDRVFISAGYSMGCTMFQYSVDAAGEFTATELWSHNKMKTQFASVTYWEGHLYGLDDGKIACLNAETGERLWKTGRYGAGVHLMLTGEGQGPRALIQSEEGPVHLLTLAPKEPTELGQLAALSSKTWNYPTPAGNVLLCRNDREAACYRLAKKAN